jgi:hypothetical protein
VVIIAVLALAAGFIYLWTHSKAFRDFFIGMWNDIWSFLKTIGRWFAGPFCDFFTKTIPAAISGFNKILDKYIVNPFLALIGFMLNAAAKAFGWIPGIGPKLKTAAKNFETFRDNVNRALNGIHNYSKTVTVTVKGNGASLVANGRVVGHLASGGTTRQSGRYLVGENGPEIADLPSGTSVYPNGVKPGPLPSGGGGRQVIEMRAAPGDQVAEILLSLLRPAVQGRYQGNVQLAIGGTNH